MCCDELEILRGEAVVIGKVMKRYQHSLGWKLTLQMGDKPTIHFVIFEGSPFFKLAHHLNVGDACVFKGIMKSNDDAKKREDVLIGIYHLRI